MPSRILSVTRRFPTALAAVLALTALSDSARAGLLQPGETGGGEEFILDLADPSFQGETLASTSTPFEFNGTNSSGEPVFFRGTFNTSVVRESATGRLAFHYQFLRGQSNQILDFENFYVSSFQGFETDVFSDQTSLSQGRATRSADGRTIDFVGDEENNANLVVRTNATAFAAGGTAALWGSFQPSGGDETQTYEAFQPVADDPGPGPNPIPLPPAVWAALSTMGAFGAMSKLRRRRH